MLRKAGFQGFPGCSSFISSISCIYIFSENTQVNLGLVGVLKSNFRNEFLLPLLLTEIYAELLSELLEFSEVTSILFKLFPEIQEVIFDLFDLSEIIESLHCF